MPLGDRAMERAPGTRSEKSPIEKPAGSLICSSGKAAGLAAGCCGAEQARPGTMRREMAREADFRFWILDFGLVSMARTLPGLRHARSLLPIQNLKSKIVNSR